MQGRVLHEGILADIFIRKQVLQGAFFTLSILTDYRLDYEDISNYHQI